VSAISSFARRGGSPLPRRLDWLVVESTSSNRAANTLFPRADSPVCSLEVSSVSLPSHLVLCGDEERYESIRRVSRKSEPDRDGPIADASSSSLAVDVVNVEQAILAQAAGACAVMVSQGARVPFVDSESILIPLPPGPRACPLRHPS
jgi:hypothetical protein